MLPLGSVIRKHGITFHSYADDTQISLSMKPNDSSPITKLDACLSDIKISMSNNFLCLNSDKTEVMMIGPKQLNNISPHHQKLLNGLSPSFSQQVKSLGVIIDQDLSLNSHVKHITKTSFFHLRNIAKVRNFLPLEDAEKLIHAFVTSRLDYCNALFSGCSNTCIKNLQLIQNAAARTLTRTKKYEHISPVLASLHWLPVKSRIDFKILLLTYKALNGLAPTYIKDLLIPYCPGRQLRSQNAALLDKPRISKSTIGGRAFSYRAPLLWNSLPLCIRESDTLNTFKARLKTHISDASHMVQGISSLLMGLNGKDCLCCCCWWSLTIPAVVLICHAPYLSHAAIAQCCHKPFMCHAVQLSLPFSLSLSCHYMNIYDTNELYKSPLLA